MKDSRKLNYLKPAVEVITLDTSDIIQTSGSTNLLTTAEHSVSNNAIWREDWN